MPQVKKIACQGIPILEPVWFSRSSSISSVDFVEAMAASPRPGLRNPWQITVSV